MRATVLLVLADLHQGLAVDGVLRIPLADIARKHLSRHPSDVAVVQLQAPITVMAFDGTPRNETEFVYFKPPASANTTDTGGIWASAPELSDHNNTLPVPITLTESADILVDIEGTDSCFLFSSGVEKCDLGLWAGCGARQTQSTAGRGGLSSAQIIRTTAIPGFGIWTATAMDSRCGKRTATNSQNTLAAT